jgi:hypothetical protein
MRCRALSQSKVSGVNCGIDVTEWPVSSHAAGNRMAHATLPKGQCKNSLAPERFAATALLSHAHVSTARVKNTCIQRVLD